MKISSPLIHAFLEICRYRSLTAAAKHLGLSQPALSLRLKSLEDLVEDTLLIRQKDGIVLTKAGARFFRFAETLEGLERECLSDLQNDATLKGTLRIGSFATIGRSLVLPSLNSFIRDHEHLQLNYTVKEIRELPGLLHSGELDIIFMDRPLSREGIENHLLGHEKYVLVAGSKYPNAPEIYLNHDENDLMSFNYWESVGTPKTSLRRRYLDEIYHVIDGVADGIGISILPRHLVRDDKRIRIIKPKQFYESPVYMITKSRSWFPRHLSQLMSKLSLDLKSSLLKI